MKTCVFAGTFDPPTLGHKALIEDCLKPNIEKSIQKFTKNH